MDSTWEQRDLPVLEAIVRYFDENPMQPGPTVGDIAQRTGRDPQEVFRAIKSLDGTYLELRMYMAGGRVTPHRVLRVTDQARRAVGQWPSPEAWVERLVQALHEAAEREPDPEKKGRLRAVAEGLGGFARDVAVGVLSGGITQSMGS
jgi:hypothetical protein